MTSVKLNQTMQGPGGTPAVPFSLVPGTRICKMVQEQTNVGVEVSFYSLSSVLFIMEGVTGALNLFQGSLHRLVPDIPHDPQPLGSSMVKFKLFLRR